MATTLEEIRTCRKANRRFWNAEVRYVIGHIRDCESRADRAHLSRLYHWLGSTLERRKWHMYLETANG